ncbi:hypothetical protein SSYRP_v1c04830 [Spiroplasma syrphidicola EA-1]|uniref:Uncharacterized protein n=1 Tax=Spiroplasma syrphidicola EA-1 TaxID=1276229 RepID=R4UIU2_9MOLU|nr:hypothetical protein [Spiroplasma syrphidicola]AGM26075.1 hypothetical protein SSYRP_v1c04830 [Spiroplasma syrphidicola EA-1]
MATINKVHIKHNWYARMIEFLNKAEYNSATKSWQAYRNDLLHWNNWGDKKLTYKPPALVEYKRGPSGKGYYEIKADLLKEAIQFWRDNYEIKWMGE